MMAQGNRIHLMTNTKQHKPKNVHSKEDDKHIYKAMLDTADYVKRRFDFAANFPNYSIEFEEEISVKYIIDFIKSKKVRSEFDISFIDRKIIPDGGILFLVRQEVFELQ